MTAPAGRDADAEDRALLADMLKAYRVTDSFVDLNAADLAQVDDVIRAFRLNGALTATLTIIADAHKGCRRKRGPVGCRACRAIRIGLAHIAANQNINDAKEAARAKR